jgi:TPR repeat protein
MPPPPLSTSVPENLPTGVPSSAVHSSAGLQYSDAEIAILMRRGDAFLTSGDITSARLFYERAAEAGSGPAALQLGATFDPVMLGRVGGRVGLADRAQALLWYRRAKDLGMVEAEQQIKRIEASSLGAGRSAPSK